MGKRSRTHPILGTVKWKDREKIWEAKVDLAPGGPIKFSMVAEDEWAEADSAEVFAAGAEYLAWAREAESRVRGKIADDLLEVYNSAWADEDPEEGTPPMDRPEFLANLCPGEINLYHDGAASWYYSCGDLFGGHDIWLMLGPDRGFKGRASLIG